MMMEPYKGELKVEMRVIGYNEKEVETYRGEIKKISDNGQINVLRDDKREGGGVYYEGRRLWQFKFNKRKDHWASDGYSGFITLEKINWRMMLE